MQTADPALMRELNRALVLKLIRDRGSISRAELSSRTNLSRSTVSSIVTDLLQTGLITEQGTGESSGGRRPILLDFNYRAGYVVGVEAGATHLLALLTDLAANVVARHETAFSTNLGPETGVQRIADGVRQVIAAGAIDPELVIGVGVGVPGPLDVGTGAVVSPPIMPGWHGVPLRQRLSQALDLPVYIDNDANLGAVAERWRGAGQGIDHLAYIKVEIGIGCGLILNGQVYRGHIGSAGEIGHTTIDPNGPACRCGNYGCLEAMASGPAIAHRAQLAVKAGQKTLLADLKPVDEIVVQDVAEVALHGDPLGLQLFNEAGRSIGVALAGLINLLNPRRVIIGGEVAEAGDILLEPIRRSVQSHALRVAVENCQIVQGQLGRDTVAIGAVSLALEEILRSPTAKALRL
jgi:glucokinase-like ROK family protein